MSIKGLFYENFHPLFSLLNAHYSLTLLPETRIPLLILLDPSTVHVSLATLFFTTPPPRYVSTFFQNIAAMIASRAIAHMRTSHIQREQNTLDLDDLGRHIREMLPLEAVEV
jgi:hypothetical protein